MIERLTLFFEPLDVLQFRDYRPFDAGSNVLGQSLFPLPSVFLGCVRGALFRALGASFGSKDQYYDVRETWAHALLGSRDRVGSLQLHGPLLARRQDNRIAERYFPMPADLAPLDQEGSHHIVLSRKQAPDQDAPRFYHGRARAGMQHETPYLPWTGCELGKPTGSPFLTTMGARAYLRAGAAADEKDRRIPLDDAHAIAEDYLLVREDRFGITRSPDTLTAEPHRFYLLRPYRLAREHGFAVEVALPASKPAQDAIRQLDDTVVQLGGRGHRARITLMQEPLLPEDMKRADRGQVARLWFLTPAPLRAGLDAWPQGMSVVAERTEAVGGFDQANRRPRPLSRALPAGAVVQVPAQDSVKVRAALCGFPSQDNETTDPETARLMRAGFAMALDAGAARGAEP